MADEHSPSQCCAVVCVSEIAGVWTKRDVAHGMSSKSYPLHSPQRAMLATYNSYSWNPSSFQVLCLFLCIVEAHNNYKSVCKNEMECVIIQIWYPCGFANMIVYPEWALSPDTPEGDNAHEG